MTADGALDRDEHALEREATFVRNLGLLSLDGDLGIDDRRHFVGLRLLEHEEALQDAYLGGRKPDAARVVHQVRHPVRQPHQVVVEAVDLTRAHPQDGVRVLPDLGERDATTRLRLSVDVLFVELFDFVFVVGTHALSRHETSLVTVNWVSVTRSRDGRVA